MSFITGFSSRFYAVPQDVVFPLDVSVTFLNYLSPDVRELLISEGFQVIPRNPTETNQQGSQRLILIRNLTVGSENKTSKIKVTLQKESGSRHPRIFMVVLGVNP